MNDKVIPISNGDDTDQGAAEAQDNMPVKFGRLVFLRCKNDEDIDPFHPSNWEPVQAEEVPEIVKEPAVITQLLLGYMAAGEPGEWQVPEYWYRAHDMGPMDAGDHATH